MNEETIGKVLRILRREIRKWKVPAVGVIAEKAMDRPFETLVSTILSLRTKDAVTEAASGRLLTRAPGPEAIAALKKFNAPVLVSMKWPEKARDTDPDGKFPNRTLLEHFIDAHAPGWDWRKEADEGIQADDIEERFAKERAISRRNASTARRRVSGTEQMGAACPEMAAVGRSAASSASRPPALLRA